jgi:hypothetical protein
MNQFSFRMLVLAVLILLPWLGLRALMRPYYFGESGTEAQAVVFPYAMLTATADTGVTNFPVSLNCPILKQDGQAPAHGTTTGSPSKF